MPGVNRQGKPHRISEQLVTTIFLPCINLSNRVDKKFDWYPVALGSSEAITTRYGFVFITFLRITAAFQTTKMIIFND